MTWAVEQECKSPGQKLVLLMLANHENGHTHRCDPSHKELAKECSMGVSTLKVHLQALSNAGLIEIISRTSEGVNLPNQYKLNTPLPGQNLAGGRPESGRGVGQNLATEPGIYNQEVNQHLFHDDIGRAEKKEKIAKATRLPEDWKLTAERESVGERVRREAGLPPVNLKLVAAEFYDYWRSLPDDRHAKKSDWEGTWRNRCRSYRAPYTANRGGSAHTGLNDIDYTAGLDKNGRPLQ